MNEKKTIILTILGEANGAVIVSRKKRKKSKPHLAPLSNFFLFIVLVVEWQTKQRMATV